MSQAQEATRRMHRKRSSPLLNVNSSSRQFVHASPCLAAYLPVLLLHSDCLYAFVPSQWFVTHLFSIRAVTELPAWPGRVSTGERQVPGEGEGNGRLLPQQQVCIWNPSISWKKMTAGQSQSFSQSNIYLARNAAERRSYLQIAPRQPVQRLGRGLYGPGFESWRGKILLFSSSSTPSLEPTQPSIQWVPGFLPGAKAAGE